MTLTAALAVLYSMVAAATAVAALPPATPLLDDEQRAAERRRADSSGDTRIPGRYIVVLEDSVEHTVGVAQAQTETHHGRLGLIYRHAIKGYSARLSKQAAEALRKNPKVKYVVADQEFEIASQSVPTGISRIRATENATADIDGTDDARVNADIAVIDSGIDPNHPDLNLYKRANCVPPGEGKESSGEDEVEECVGNSGTDGNGHGTHVAGTAAAIDNGIGVVGAAPGARLWSVKVFNQDGQGYGSWLLAGIDWVRAHAAEIEVANMSLSCNCSFLPVETAVENAVKAGVVISVAAGNSHVNAIFAWPAKSPHVITVSALADYDGKPGGKAASGSGSEDDVLAWFSNNGAAVEVAAPGVNIYSTLPTGGSEHGTDYGYLSGTSMAAPHVAGAAALIASKSNPNDKTAVEAIRQQLIDEGSQHWTDRYLFNGEELRGSGWTADGIQEPLLDVGPQAAATYTTRAIDLDLAGAVLNGGVNPNGTPTNYQFEYGTTTSYGSKAPASPTSIGSGTKDVKAAKEISGLKPNTTYHFRLVSTGAKTVFGDDKTFTTLASTITQEASGITAHSARLKGKVNPLGSQSSYRFEYGTTTSYGSTTPSSPQSIGSESKWVEVARNVSGLYADTFYHFRVVSTNAKGETHYGKDQLFRTTSSAFVAGPSSEAVFGDAQSAGVQPGFFIETHQIKYPNNLCYDGPDFEGEVGSGTQESLTVEVVETPTCVQTAETTGSEASLDFNGCRFELYPGSKAPEGTWPFGAPTVMDFVGTFDIACPVGQEIIFPSSMCEIRIPAQTGLAVTYRNIDDGTVEAVLDSFNVRHTQYSENTWCLDGTFDDGGLWGRWILEADGEGETPLEVRDSLFPERIAAYSFNEAAGTTVTDAVGDHNGVISGASWTSAGKYGPALDFDGNDLVSIADAADLDLTDSFTLEAWVRPDSLANWSPAVTKSSGNPLAGYALNAQGQGGPAGNVGTAAGLKGAGVTTPLPTGSWSHLAFTSDGTVLRLYVDGKLVKTNSSGGAALANASDLAIGFDNYLKTYFDGKIDEVRIYGEPLSEARIQLDRNRPVPPQRVAAYSFDWNSGKTLVDSTGNHDGTIFGATWVPGPYGDALNFDGIDDFVSIPDAADLDLTGAFTLEAWVRPDQLSGARSVIGKSEGLNSGYALSTEYDTGKPKGTVGDGTTRKWVTGSEPLPSGGPEDWSHLAFTSDGTTLRLYLNGALTASGPAVGVKATATDLRIGNVPFLGYFDGLIDEVRIYDVPLTEEEIVVDLSLEEQYWLP
jgi:subtilisin family serine protease